MDFKFSKQDFKMPFRNPQLCAFAQVLRRYGFKKIFASTLEAFATIDNKSVLLIVNAVYFNVTRIDNGIFGFGPVGFKAMLKAYEQDENTSAFISVTRSYR